MCLCHVGVTNWQTVSLWQSIPQEIIDSHELQSITLDYRRECQQNDIVDSLTSVEPIEGAEVVPQLKGTNGSATARDDDKQECQQFLHLLRLSTGGLEINRGRTAWRKKAPRWGLLSVLLSYHWYFHLCCSVWCFQGCLFQFCHYVLLILFMHLIGIGQLDSLLPQK